jgi:hypothetical protein
LLQPTGAHPIDALLVFLHLLKGQAEPNGQLLLAHAEHDAPHAKSAADVLVDEVWCFHFARSADSKAFHRLALLAAPGPTAFAGIDELHGGIFEHFCFFVVC